MSISYKSRTVMSSSEEIFNPSQLGMPACIRLRFGSFELVAVVSTGCWLSLMSRDIYEKLRRISPSCPIIKESNLDDVKVYDGCGGVTEMFKEVQVHATIEDQNVPIKLNVVRKLISDIVLGGEFVGSVQGVLHYGLGAFKWQFNSRIIVSYFITTSNDLIINHSDLTAIKNESPNSSSNRPNAENFFTSMGLAESSIKSSTENQGNDNEQNPDYIDYFETKIAHEVSRTTNSIANWRNVYVMTKELLGIFSDHSMGYNGIFWGKGSKFNVVFGTSLENTHLENFHLIAISKIIQTAKDNQWKCLRIFSNNEFVTRVFNYALCAGVRKIPKDKDLEFLDFRAFRYVLNNADRVHPLVFEYVPNITEVSEMRKLERLIDLHITNN